MSILNYILFSYLYSKLNFVSYHIEHLHCSLERQRFYVFLSHSSSGYLLKKLPRDRECGSSEHSALKKWSGGRGSIPAPGARILLFGPVSVWCDRLRQVSWSPRSVSVWQHVNLSDVSLGTCLRYSLVSEEDIKKLNICLGFWVIQS